MVLAVAETTAIRLMGQLLWGCSSMENNNRPRMGICAAVCGCNFIPQAETEISIDMEMQERHHFTICMPCLSECGTATGIDCTNSRLTMLPEMQTQFQPTWLLIVLQWTDRCRAAHRTRSSCWTTSKPMGMTVLAIFALMHRRLKAKFHHLKFKAYLTPLINRGWRRSGNLLYPPRNHSSCCATIARGAIIVKICTDPMLMRPVQGRQSFATISNRFDHGSGSAGPNSEVFNLDESDMSENLMQLF